jgi:peptidyl-dipeptidase Dcp
LLAKQMYGLTFKERNDLPVYHPDVKGMKYMILMKINRDLLFDFYTRDNKNGGAWMSNFVSQSHYLKQNQ